MRKFKLLENFRKHFVALFLTSNLLLVSTGSASLDLASDSANLVSSTPTPSSQPLPTDQTSTQSASPEPNSLNRIKEILRPMPKYQPSTKITRIDRQGDFFEDEIGLGFVEGTNEETQARIIEENGLIVKLDLPQVKVKMMAVEPNKREAVIAKLKVDPNVRYVNRAYVVRSREGSGSYGGSTSGSCNNPNDYYWCDSFDPHNWQWGLKAIGAQYTWGITKGSSDNAIAVIDSGIDYNHYEFGVALPSFKGTVDGRAVLGRDILDPYLYNDPVDGEPHEWSPGTTVGGHGTAVAGIIGAKTNNLQGIAASDWLTRLVAIKATRPEYDKDHNYVGEFTTPSILAEAIAQAYMPEPLYNLDWSTDSWMPPAAKVINISLGLLNDDSVLRQTVADAIAAGVIIVAAPENSKADRNCPMGFPAAYPGVISVDGIAKDGSTFGCTDNVWEGTTYQRLQLTAPGKDIYTTLIGSGLGFAGESDPNFPEYSRRGTSFAAPFVAGAASILLVCPSQPSTSQVKSWLISSAEDRGTAGWDSTYGYGVVNVFLASFGRC